MKVDKRFHCFGCQADGDVINFTGRLFSLSPREAALKLADDFGIQYDEHQPVRPVRRVHEISSDEIMDHRLSHCFRELTDYRNHLIILRELYAPKFPEEEWHPLFVEALQKIAYQEYLLDCVESEVYEIEHRNNTAVHG